MTSSKAIVFWIKRMECLTILPILSLLSTLSSGADGRVIVYQNQQGSYHAAPPVYRQNPPPSPQIRYNNNLNRPQNQGQSSPVYHWNPSASQSSNNRVQPRQKPQQLPTNTLVRQPVRTQRKPGVISSTQQNYFRVPHSWRPVTKPNRWPGALSRDRTRPQSPTGRPQHTHGHHHSHRRTPPRPIYVPNPPIQITPCNPGSAYYSVGYCNPIYQPLIVPMPYEVEKDETADDYTDEDIQSTTKEWANDNTTATVTTSSTTTVPLFTEEADEDENESTIATSTTKQRKSKRKKTASSLITTTSVITTTTAATTPLLEEETVEDDERLTTVVTTTKGKKSKRTTTNVPA